MATTFARPGNPVVAFEIDARRIAGRTPTLEPVLQGQAMPCCQNTHFRSPQAKKAAFEKAGTLNARGVAEALRRDLGKVVPELRRIPKPSTNARRRTGLELWAYA